MNQIANTTGYSLKKNEELEQQHIRILSNIHLPSIAKLSTVPTCKLSIAQAVLAYC